MRNNDGNFWHLICCSFMAFPWALLLLFLSNFDWVFLSLRLCVFSNSLCVVITY